MEPVADQETELGQAVYNQRCSLRVASEGDFWRDKTRLSRIPPLAPEVADRVIALTLAGPQGVNAVWTWT